MSEKAKRYKSMYQRKLITEAQLNLLVGKGILTTEEMEWILSD